VKESTKIRLKAIGLLFLMLVFSPLTFLVAGLHEQFFAQRARPGIPFVWGVKIMLATYIDVGCDLVEEIKQGVEILGEDD